MIVYCFIKITRFWDQGHLVRIHRIRPDITVHVCNPDIKKVPGVARSQFCETA